MGLKSNMPKVGQHAADGPENWLGNLVDHTINADQQRVGACPCHWNHEREDYPRDNGSHEQKNDSVNKAHG